jgi:hypothetical protein
MSLTALVMMMIVRTREMHMLDGTHGMSTCVRPY